MVTAAGPAWRCLRCWTFVVGAPGGSGPADRAPDVLRGAALRDVALTRLLALERVLHGLLFTGLAVAVLLFRHQEGFLRVAYDQDLRLLTPVLEQLGFHLDHSWLLQQADRVFGLSPHTLAWVGAGLAGYACLQFTEAVGLWSGRRWGEYFAVVSTSVFLPWEILELVEKVTWLRLLLFAVNLVALAWLVFSKRLFGVRGGAAAQGARHHEESLVTVERAAVAAAGPAPFGA